MKRSILSLVIWSRDLEPITTKLEPSERGPVLTLESSTFNASLPASPFILKLLANKLSEPAQA